MANAADEQRLRNLETRVQELQAENARLRAVAPLQPAAPAPEEEAVRLIYPTTCPIPMPSQSEYERLLAIVEHSGVVPHSVDRGEFFTGFMRSFERIASLRRLGGLNFRRSARDWASEAEGWLKQRGTPAETSNGSFFAACIAAGDIPFSFPNMALGISAFVGLTSDTDARLALPAWREVLGSGQPRKPEAAPHSLRPGPTPVVKVVG